MQAENSPLLVVTAALDAMEAGHPELVYGNAAARVRGRLPQPLSETDDHLHLPATLHVVGASETPIRHGE